LILSASTSLSGSKSIPSFPKGAGEIRFFLVEVYISSISIAIPISICFPTGLLPDIVLFPVKAVLSRRSLGGGGSLGRGEKQLEQKIKMV